MKYRALDQRYEVAVEVRNNLVAASQNIQGAQNYLSSVKFPYCAPPEVDTLNKVNEGIFSIGLNKFMKLIQCKVLYIFCFNCIRQQLTYSRTCRHPIAMVMRWNVTLLLGKDVVLCCIGLHK